MKRNLAIISLLLVFNFVHCQIRLEIENEEIKEYFEDIVSASDSLISNDLVTIAHADGFGTWDYDYRYQDHTIVYAYEEALNKGIFSGVFYYSPDHTDIVCELTHDIRGRERFLYYIIKYKEELHFISVQGKLEKYKDQIEHMRKIIEYEP